MIARAIESGRFGWNQVGPVDIHVGHSLAWSLGASVVASAMATGMGANLNLFPLAQTAHFDDTRTVTEVHRSIATQRITETHSTATDVETVDPEPSISKKIDVYMPNAPSFKLDGPAGKIINPAAIAGGFTWVDAQKRQGYELVRVEIDAGASDEDRTAPGSGIGVPNPATNGALSVLRGKFITGALQSGYAKRSIDGKAVNKVSATEHVLDPAQVAALAKVATHQLMSVTDFIQKYKTGKIDTASIGEADVKTVTSLIDKKRGGTVTYVMELGATSQKQIVTTTNRCVDETAQIITTSQQEQPFDRKITGVVLPIPILRRRKYNQNSSLPSTGPDIAPAPDTNTVDQASATPARNSATYPRFERPSTRLDRALQYNRDGLISPRQLGIEKERYLRHDRALRRTGLAAIALLAALVRPDLGYCPNPGDHESQSARWGDAPDYIGIGLGIVGTDFQTPKLEIMPAICKTSEATPKPSATPGQSEPTCDTRAVRYVNGQVTYLNETHFPGATTISSTTTP